MFLEKLKELLKKDGNENDKKKIENLVIFVIILIVTILVVNKIWNEDGKVQITNTDYTQLAEKKDVDNMLKVSSEYSLEQDLEKILSKISGAGKVNVLVTYSESSQIIPLSNEKYKETRYRRK